MNVHPERKLGENLQDRYCSVRGRTRPARTSVFVSGCRSSAHLSWSEPRKRAERRYCALVLHDITAIKVIRVNAYPLPAALMEKRAQTFGERLRSLLYERKISQISFAEKLGISRARLNNYLADRSEPNQATLINIADLLKINTDYLLGRAASSGCFGTQENAPVPFFTPYGLTQTPSDAHPDAIPLYLSWTKNTPASNATAPIGWLPFRKVSPQRSYALLVADDSMEPALLKGDVAYIQLTILSHALLSDLSMSDVFSVRLTPDDTIGLTLKRCHIRDNTLLLLADNTAYDPIILDMNKALFRPLVGKVAAFWRSWGTSHLERFLPCPDETRE